MLPNGMCGLGVEDSHGPTFGPQLVVLFGKIVEPLGDGALLQGNSPGVSFETSQVSLTS